MKYYSFDTVIYDSGLDAIRLLVKARDKECFIAFEDEGKDEDGYFINSIAIGLPDYLPLDTFDAYIRAIDSDKSWIEVDSSIFFSKTVFDKNNWEEFFFSKLHCFN